MNENTCGFDPTGVDLSLSHNNQLINVEIKCNDAQMGESSFTYRHDRETKFIPARGRMDPDISELIISEILTDMEPHIQNLLDYLRQQEPVSYHAEITGLPLRVTKRAWNEAVQEGVLKPVNGRILFDERIIEHHYTSKGVFYIQIEDRGLFYLKENPLDLPIPRLQGDVMIEVRMKRGGSTPLVGIGENAATVVLRASGRLKFKNKSDFSLDDVNSIRSLFGGRAQTCMDTDVQRGCAA